MYLDIGVKLKIKSKLNNVLKLLRSRKKRAVNKITSNDGEKDKQISAKVNNISWENFTKINKAQGLSNNSALNMLINKYVRENKEILED